MGKRIVLMISMVVTAFAILLTSDLVSTEMIYGELNSMSVTVSYYISKSGGVTDSIKSFVQKEISADIYCAMDDCTAVKKGDTFFYIIEKEYRPIITHKSENKITIKRSVVIGLYE